MEFIKFANEYYLPHYRLNHKPNSVDALKSEIRRITPYLSSREVEEIKGLDLIQMFDDLQLRLAANTVIRTYKITKGIFDFAIAADLIEKNPMAKVPRPKEEHKKVDALTKAQVGKFLDAIKWNSPSLEFRTKMFLLISTGLRRGELLGLKWEDIDFSGGYLQVKRELVKTSENPCLETTLKSNSSYRKIMLTPNALELLRNLHISNKGEWVFRSRYPNTLTHEVKKFMAANGLGDFSPHDLRHSCATYLIQSGADVKTVQALLGHSNPAITLKYYVAEDEAVMAEAVSVFDRIA
jgi:integrase